jgi:hypothetical protein
MSFNMKVYEDFCFRCLLRSLSRNKFREKSYAITRMQDSHNINTDNIFSESVAKFKCFGTT